MPHAILIHGYATELRASIFRKPCGGDAGFAGLRHEIQNGSVEVFHWGTPMNLSFIESLDLRRYLQLYRTEEATAESLITQSTLREYLDNSNPQTVICHSLGCRLLLNTMNAHGIPESITKIVFLQGDVSTTATITNSDIRHRIISKSLIIENYFCPWDPSLIASMILHGERRIGLMSWNQPGIRNIFSPLLKPINLHTSQLRNRKFLHNVL